MKKAKLTPRKNILRIIALTILSIPIIFVSLFLFGELFSGDISGLGHLFQIIPLVILWLLARRFPYVMGLLLVAMGTILLIIYNLYANFSFPPVSILMFLPIVASGVLLFISSRPKLP